MSEPKPLWDFRETCFVPSVSFLGKDIKHKMKEIINVEQLENNHLCLLREKSEYLLTRRLLCNRPNPTEVKKALEILAKRSSELLECMEALDDITLYYHLLEPYGKIADEKYQQIKEELQNLDAAAIMALRDISKSKGGRPRNIPLKEYIIDLADIFELITNKKPGLTCNNYGETARYSGKFFKFVESCLTHIEKQIQDQFNQHENLLQNLSKEQQNTLKTKPKNTESYSKTSLTILDK